MTRWLLVVASLIASVIVSAPTVHAQPSGPCYFSACPRDTSASVGGTATGNLQARVTRVADDVVPGRGTPGQYGEAPERTTWQTREEYLAPSCAANGLLGEQTLCPVALSSCPDDTQIRYWIWERLTTHTRGAEPVVGPWTQLPGSYCLGPDDPGVPTIGQVIGRVQTAFRDLPLPVAAPQVDPAPTTLVNIPTAFFAGGSTTATFEPVILGVRVVIDAEATSWTWDFGDGTPPRTFSTPGVPKRPVVSHVYRRAADLRATVTASWTGTFRIAGSDEVLRIRTPVLVESEPVPVQVREARTELVAG